MTRPPGAWLHRSVRTSSSSAAQHDRAARALVDVVERGDSRGFRRLLHPGVVLMVDGGGVVPAPVAGVEGASAVGGYLGEVLIDAAVSLRVEAVNGMSGVVVCRAGRVIGVLSTRVRGRLILEAWLVLNPEKLTHWTC